MSLHYVIICKFILSSMILSITIIITVFFVVFHPVDKCRFVSDDIDLESDPGSTITLSEKKMKTAKHTTSDSTHNTQHTSRFFFFPRPMDQESRMEQHTSNSLPSNSSSPQFNSSGIEVILLSCNINSISKISRSFPPVRVDHNHTTRTLTFVDQQWNSLPSYSSCVSPRWHHFLLPFIEQPVELPYRKSSSSETQSLIKTVPQRRMIRAACSVVRDCFQH